MQPAVSLDLLAGTFAICRLPPNAAVPEWAAGPGPFLSITRTADELSITAPEREVPAGVRAERDYRAFRVRGVLAPELVGILVSIAQPLAQAGVSIFAISTFDTDYVLVKARDLAVAVDALRDAGHQVAGAA
jgi:hypothetical protein